MHPQALLKLLPLTMTILLTPQLCAADIAADAETILNWAEKNFPAILPGHDTTKTLEPYLYRNYPQTKLYVGINKQNSNVYYIGEADLIKGVAPSLYDSVANVLKQAAPAGTSPSGPSTTTACNTATLPAGITATQSGNVIKIATNGCIPEPEAANSNLCSSTAMGNVSIKATLTFQSTTNGVSETSKFVACTSHASGENSSARVESDLCYISKTTPPVTTRTIGTQVYERVDDCLKTDAQTVSDLLTGDTYVNAGSGFIKLPSFK